MRAGELCLSSSCSPLALGCWHQGGCFTPAVLCPPACHLEMTLFEFLGGVQGWVCLRFPLSRYLAVTWSRAGGTRCVVRFQGAPGFVAKSGLINTAWRAFCWPCSMGNVWVFPGGSVLVGLQGCAGSGGISCVDLLGVGRLLQSMQHGVRLSGSCSCSVLVSYTGGMPEHVVGPQANCLIKCNKLWKQNCSAWYPVAFHVEDPVHGVRGLQREQL